MIFIDIETVPTQDAIKKQEIIDSVVVKCPFKTKAEIGADLCMDDKDVKFTGADDLKLRWINEKGEAQKVEQGLELWKKTALDGAYGQIVSIAWAKNDEKTECICGPDEKGLLLNFWDVIGNTGAAEHFVAHNKGFDLPYIWKRSVINGVVPSIRFDPYSRDHECTMEMWAGFKGMIGLDRLAGILGVKGKSGDGCQVFDWFDVGDFDSISTYNIDDVEVTRNCYQRMKFY